MEDRDLLSTRDVAKFLNINEKVVYALIQEKGLPATRVTGKWLFPRHLVAQWIENSTLNYPPHKGRATPSPGLLIVCGSNDILLDRTLSLYHRLYPDHFAVFGNVGSLGGIQALRRNLCHVATSHLMEEDAQEYNFGPAREELGALPGIINFCRREQGLLLQRGNPSEVRGMGDLGRPGIRIVNRPLGTGTRQLLDKELRAAGISPESLDGYDREFRSHLDVGIEVLSGRADAAPCIRAVAGILDLDFLPLRWERFDLLVARERFFEQEVQRLLGLLLEPAFRSLAEGLTGYDLSLCGKMVFPEEAVTR